MFILQITENSVREITASHEYIYEKSIMDMIKSDMFTYMNEAYKFESGGFQSFSDANAMVRRSALWYVTYDGIREEDYEVFDVSRVMTVSMFREFHGLKMVAFGKNRHYVPHIKPLAKGETKRNMDAAIRKHIKFIVKHGWAEVSGDLEDLFIRYAGYDYVIDPEELYEHHIFSDLKPGMDATHYSRPLSQSNPKLIYKAAYGTIRW